MMRLSKNLTLFITLFFIATIFLSSCGSATNVQPSKTPTQTTISPETTTDSKYDRSYEQYITAMDKYKSMSVDTFESLPRDERTLYPQFMIAENAWVYDTVYTNNTEAKNFAIDLPEASINNTGQEILDINLYANQMSYLQMIRTEDNPKPYDSVAGQKMLSAMFYEVGGNKTTSDNYKDNKDIRASLTTWFPISTINTATKTSEVINGKDSDGVPVEYKVVTFNNQDNETCYACFVYYEFQNYDGEGSATWLQYDQSDNMNTLKTPTAIE